MRNLRTLFVQGAAILVAMLSFSLTGDAAQYGLTYAITNARIVTVSGATIDNGTVLIQDGIIKAVGTSVTVPVDAVVTDGSGMTVYPGLIDMSNSAPIEGEEPASAQAGRGGGFGGRGGGGGQTFATLEEADRAKRAALVRPDYVVADHLTSDNDALTQLANAGITTVLAVPSSGIFKGQSALVNVALPPDDPQISAPGRYRKGLAVVKSPIAQHINIYGRGGGPGYPNSLLGTIALTRQALLDAEWQRDATATYEQINAKGPRPMVEPSLDALQPALAGEVPVIFDANEGREIDRSLVMAKDFGLTPIIVGGSEASDRIDELKAANAKVLLTINYASNGGGGGRGGGRGGGGNASLRSLRLQQNAPKVPGMLAQAGIPFAFASGGSMTPADFVRNAGRTVTDGGLTPDAAIKALTLDAAKIAGADDRLGSIDVGKIANVIVTSGDLFDSGTRIRHVFIDGVPVMLTEAPAATGGRGGRGGGQR